MSKGDLITAIANRAGLTKKSAADALEAFIATISGELTNGEQVTITGFGTFKVSHRAARTGVNPQNPTQKIQIKASKVPTFKAGKNLKESVNGK